MKPNYNTINHLTNFCRHCGHLNVSRNIKINEPFYDKYMLCKLKSLGVANGDIVEVKTSGNIITGKVINNPFDDIPTLNIMDNVICTTHEVHLFANDENIIINVAQIEDVSIVEKCKNPQQMEQTPCYQKTLDNSILEDKRNELYIEKICGQAKSKESVYLNIVASLYHPHPYGDESNVEITDAYVQIRYKNGDTKSISNNVIRENGNGYYTVCSQKDDAKSIVLEFENYNELCRLLYISCTWTLMIDNEQMQILTMVYPKFEPQINECKIYNVSMIGIRLEEASYGLYTPTVFSGEFYEDYKFVGIHVKNDKLIVINGELDCRETFDIATSLHKDSIDDFVSMMRNDKEQYVEIYVQNAKIMALPYVDTVRKMGMSIIKNEIWIDD